MYMFKKILAALVIVCSGGALNAQTLVNDKVDIIAGSGVYNTGAVIYTPANYDATKTYPLVIFTHGMGEAGSDVNRLYNTGLPKVLRDGYRPSFDFIMIAPQRSSYSVDPAWLVAILEDANKRWKIDNDRVYITGLSAGGWGAYGSQLNVDTVLAKKFAAIVVNSAATQDANKTRFDWFKTSKTPVWAVVGNNDVSYRDQNIYMIDEINKRVSGLGKISIRSGIGHGGWNDVYNGTFKLGTQTMWEWLYMHKRGTAVALPPPPGPTNTPPTVMVGSAQTITLPTSTVMLTGTATDNDGTVASYSWSKISGPAAGTITSTTTASTSVTGLVAGVYDFQLTATDNLGAKGTAVKRITVNAATTTGLYVTHTLQTTAPGEVYRPTGTGLSNWKPGDTVNIPAGNYSLIDLGNFRGDATRPIILRNKGGLVTVKQIRFGKNAQYFKLLGNGHPGLTYGILVNGTSNAGIAAYHVSDIEIAHVEVTGMEAGFLIKWNPVAGDAASQYPSYTMKNMYLHHNYIHHVTGEAMYIGHTAPSGDPYNGNLIPIRLENIEIAYNIVDNTGWDGIQLSNARGNAKIHHNTVTNFGTKKYGNQMCGIILGGNTSGDVYDNTVKFGTGIGIMVFGYGTNRVYNNYVESAGNDGTATGSESIFADDRTTSPEVNAKQQMMIYSNIIKFPMPKGAIRVGAYNNNSLPSTIQNNTLYIPNAPTNWQSLHIAAHVAGSTVTGNTVVR